MSSFRIEAYGPILMKDFSDIRLQRPLFTRGKSFIIGCEIFKNEVEASQVPYRVGFDNQKKSQKSGEGFTT